MECGVAMVWLFWYGLLSLSLLWYGAEASYTLSSSGSMTPGCFSVTGTVTKDMAQSTGSYSCNNIRCPSCFVLNTLSAPAQLTLQNCNQDAFVTFHGTSVLTTFEFTNAGFESATVTDGEAIYVLPRSGLPGSSMKCTCSYLLSNAQLQCDTTTLPVHFSNVAASYTRSDACMEVTDASNSYNLFSKVCNSKHCPYCFKLNTASNAVTLTITNCNYYQGIDMSSSGIVRYEFTNTGTNNGYIADGTNVYTLAPKGVGASTTTCFCDSNLLVCSVATVRGASASPAVGIASFPEALSVTDQVNMASSLSVRSFSKFGSYLRLNDQELQLSTDANTYIKYNSGVQFYVSSNRALSLRSAAGTLHGTWSSDGIVTTSDARLKKHIEPLQDTLRRLRRGNPNARKANDSDVEEKDDEPIAWLLNKLRPVSYIHVNDENGGRRFGFLAQELERTLPDIVRVDSDQNRTKRVYLMDLVAVAVAGVQHHQQRLALLEAHGGLCQRAIEDKVSKLEQAVERLSSRLDRCCAT